jgi:hypothetical protein
MFYEADAIFDVDFDPEIDGVTAIKYFSELFFL